jgi:hypothetical protein
VGKAKRAHVSVQRKLRARRGYAFSLPSYVRYPEKGEPIGWVERSETHHLQPRHARAMTNYRQNFICGGSFFFTANLAERRER